MTSAIRQAVLHRAFGLAARAVCGLVGLGLAIAAIGSGREIFLPELTAWLAAWGWLWTLLAAGLGFGLARRGWPPVRLLMRPARPLFLGAAFALALGTGIWAHFAIQKGVPDIPDELSYLHQARGFADGVLAPESPPLADFHYVSWGVHDRGRWYSVFPPGYGALLAIGVKAGLPWLVNPLLGALLVLALFALACDLFEGDGVGPRISVLLYLGSWFRLMHAGSYMSHPLAALLTALAALGAWRGIIAGTARSWALTAGVALGVLAATRPLNAVLLVIALAPFGLRRSALLRLWPALAALIPILIGYGAYNRTLTGAALLPPQQRYMEIKEQVKDCFRLGFGPGVGECPITQNTNYGKNGFQPRDAAINTGRRIDAFIRYSFGFAPLVLLPALGALLGAASVAAARRRALAAWLLIVTVVGYGLFFYHGVAYGARFYYEAFAFTLLLSAAGIVDLGRRLRTDVAGSLGAALPALLITGMIASWPAVDKHAGQRQRTQNGAQLAALRLPELRDAIVFADSMIIPAAMTEHPGAIDANHPLVVRDQGDAANAGFLRLHPGRPAYRLVGRKTVPLALPEHAPVRHEGGGLYPLEIAEGGFGDRISSDQAFNLPLSLSEALRFRANRDGARFAFPTWLPDEAAGAVTLHLETIAHDAGATIRVSIDGQPASAWLSTRMATPRLLGLDVPISLGAGRHWIQIELADDGPRQLLLDYIELRRPGG